MVTLKRSKETRLNLPMDEAQLVNSVYCEGNLSHVEACDVLGKDLVLDEHGHQVTTGQELHEHVEEGVVLESGV